MIAVHFLTEMYFSTWTAPNLREHRRLKVSLGMNPGECGVPQSNSVGCLFQRSRPLRINIDFPSASTSGARACPLAYSLAVCNGTNS